MACQKSYTNYNIFPPLENDRGTDEISNGLYIYCINSCPQLFYFFSLLLDLRGDYIGILVWLSPVENSLFGGTLGHVPPKNLSIDKVKLSA